MAQPPPTAVASITASASRSSAPESSAAATVTATAAPAASVAAATSQAKPPQGAPSTTGQPIQDIVFGLDSYLIMSATSVAELKRAAQELAKTPGKRLLIRGHSDHMGLRDHKQALSQRRAATVKNFLVSHGAPPDRISIEAVGDSEPADPGDNPVAWARNRRVQVLWR
jgi:outer membrane protein OmpA-like peptidoglycan-associated protein